MKDVIISIRSVHSYDMDDAEQIDFTTDGLYSFDGSVGRMSYLESEVTGMPGTRTSLEVTPSEITVDRDGFITSRMVFKEGLKNSFQYNTPFGMATLGMDTRKIRHSFNENGGSAEIDYVLDMEHVVVARNKFLIKVEPQIGERANG